MTVKCLKPTNQSGIFSLFRDSPQMTSSIIQTKQRKKRFPHIVVYFYQNVTMLQYNKWTVQDTHTSVISDDSTIHCVNNSNPDGCCIA
jgi:hypothetical protein